LTSIAKVGSPLGLEKRDPSYISGNFISVQLVVISKSENWTVKWCIDLPYDFF